MMILARLRECRERTRQQLAQRRQKLADLRSLGICVDCAMDGALDDDELCRNCRMERMSAP